MNKSKAAPGSCRMLGECWPLLLLHKSLALGINLSGSSFHRWGNEIRVWKALVSKAKALATSPPDRSLLSWMALTQDLPLIQKTRIWPYLGSEILFGRSNRATIWCWHRRDGGWASWLLTTSWPISGAGWPHHWVQCLLSNDRAGFHCWFLQPFIY